MVQNIKLKHFKHFEMLYKYLIDSNFKGWDLFDGLNSKLFKNSSVYRSEIARLFFIQFFKRSPINFRKPALVPKDFNAKGLGLFVSGLIATGKRDEAKKLLTQLGSLTCSDYSEICWGYNFDWQARAFFVPVGKPNIVTTVFVANSYLDYLDEYGEDSDLNCLQKAVGACEFILKRLILFENDETLCFGYIPGENARVHNASMLGASLLARVYSITKNPVYLEKSRKAMAYSVNALKPDCSWPYGELGHHQFVDNFHTGFNLVALKNWMDFTGDKTWENELRNAYSYFLSTFWMKNGSPKYYNNSLYPIDIHCSAQGIVTCLKLAEYDERSVGLAGKIAEWAVENMQDKAGYFYYQKTRFYTNRIPYIRWAQAWMFYALSMLTAPKESNLVE